MPAAADPRRPLLSRAAPIAGATALAAWGAGLLAVRRPDLVRLDLLEVAAGPAALAGVLVAALLAAAVLRRPGLGLLLVVGAIYLNLSEVLVRQHGLPSLLQLLTLLVAVAALAERTGDAAAETGPARLRRLALHPLTLALAAYLLVLLVSTTLAWDRELADERGIEAFKAFVLYLLVAQLASTPRRLAAGARTVVACAAFLAALGVVQFATAGFENELGGLARVKDAHIVGEVFEPRIAGPLGDPNFFAQALLVAVPLALFAAWEARGRGAHLAALAGAGLVTAAIVLTYSRGGALALGCVLGLAFLARRVRRGDLALGAALLAALVVAAPDEFARRLTTLSEVVPGGEETLHPDSSFEKRRLLGLVAWEVFLDHPLAGVGAGNYTVHFDRYAAQVGSAARQYGEAEERQYPHNLYLEIAAETGVLGLAAFAAALAAAFAALLRARRRWERAGQGHMAGLAHAFAIALAGYLVSSLFLHGHYQRYLFLLFAFAAALSLGEPEERPAAA
ncbi:MAG TPA: O-antigen ligase family protein [Thermoanaerobaculia bacterium]|nr:O-antigen ligase family protein [Thermoanaerobaculia bacterium]